MENPWYYDIKNFIQNHAYPIGASKIDKKTLRRLVDGTLLRCLDEFEAKNALREVHERDLLNPC
jgi:hypothetical protein